jgi:hypothetical protein
MILLAISRTRGAPVFGAAQTFEPSCPQRQALYARTVMMHHVPQVGLAKPAVAACARDFDPDHIDVDLLVEFTPGSQHSSWGPYFELKGAPGGAAWAVGRPGGSAPNLASIERDRLPLYGA